jgi:hypothetical protein
VLCKKRAVGDPLFSTLLSQRVPGDFLPCPSLLSVQLLVAFSQSRSPESQTPPLSVVGSLRHVFLHLFHDTLLLRTTFL